MKKGYTFIEILVVVTIIGIITTVGLVSYTEFLKQSRDAKRKGDIEQIRGALELYRSDIGRYPPTTDVVFGNNLCDPGGCGVRTYITKISNDPRTGVYKYYYVSDATGTTYTLGTYLEQTPSAPSSCGNCIILGTLSCNYCMGPYGQL